MRLRLVGVGPTVEALRRLAPPSRDDLLAAVGAVVEGQTRLRLAKTKQDPDGRRWQAWAVRTRETAKPGASLLMRHGRLIDSIAYKVKANAVTIGTPLRYAAVHQSGGRHTPARPFLGVGLSDASAIESVVHRFLAKAVAR